MIRFLKDWVICVITGVRICNLTLPFHAFGHWSVVDKLCGMIGFASEMLEFRETAIELRKLSFLHC